MATSVLCIVESAYRATIEEQDDTVLWLSHMLRTNGLDVSVLLRANAVNYAVANQGDVPLCIGEVAVAQPPRLDHDLGALAGAGVPIYVITEDADERAVGHERLADAVEMIGRDDVPELLCRFDRVFHW